MKSKLAQYSLQLLGYGLDDRSSILGRVVDFSFRHGFQTSTGTLSRAMGSGALPLEIKRPGREANNPPTAEIKNEWKYTSIHSYIFVALCIIKHSDQFTIMYCSNFPVG
jgi:hypothetical protein